MAEPSVTKMGVSYLLFYEGGCVLPTHYVDLLCEKPLPLRPHGGKGMPFQTTVGGKHGGCIGTRGRVHETTTDSRTRSTKPGDGIHVPGLLHRHRLASRGLSAYA